MTQHDLFAWGRPSEVERRTRIRLCVAAYAYEIASVPLMDDAQYDRLAAQSDRTVMTGQWDAWWNAQFEPHTGQWIHTHPDLTGVARLYRRLVTA